MKIVRCCKFLTIFNSKLLIQLYLIQNFSFHFSFSFINSLHNLLSSSDSESVLDSPENFQSPHRQVRRKISEAQKWSPWVTGLPLILVPEFKILKVILCHGPHMGCMVYFSYISVYPFYAPHMEFRIRRRPSCPNRAYEARNWNSSKHSKFRTKGLP